MSEPVPLVLHPRRSRDTPAPHLPSYRYLAKRLGRLGLDLDTLPHLHTYGDLQAVAKRAYYALARRYHVDGWCSRRPRQSPGHPPRSRTFSLVTETYRWVCQFPREAPLPHYQAPTHGLHYDTPPIAEHALPLALTRREVRLAWGWQVQEGG